MKILVIDDKAENRQAAVDRLSAIYEIKTVGSYDEALNRINDNFDFDIVLIDLMMPASNRILGDNCEHQRGDSMPYGFPLMIKIAKVHAERVNYIAIVSDVNHHNHAMSACLDTLLGGYVRINGVHCSFLHAYVRNSVKYWDVAVKEILHPEGGWEID